jgi:hypothetical protein
MHQTSAAKVAIWLESRVGVSATVRNITNGEVDLSFLVPK